MPDTKNTPPPLPQPVGADASVVASHEDAPSGAKPFDPGFIPEGTRQELEQRGEAINPFTGKRLIK